VREVNTGFGDGLASAFEMLATPAIFGFVGHLVDEHFGTAPLFLLVFAITVFLWEIWKLFARYTAEMDQHLANGPWAKKAAAPAADAGSSDAGPATHLSAQDPPTKATRR